MFIIPKKLLDLLSFSEKKNGAILLFMISLMAILDVAGVASIMPFIAILSNPSLVESNVYLKYFFEKFDFNGITHFQLILGLLVLLILLFTILFRSLTLYAQTRYCQNLEYNISKRLVEGYLNQPYEWFLTRHSADLGKTILSEVNNVIGNALTPIITILSQTLTVLAILILLIVTDPLLAFIIFSVLIASYGAIFFVSSKILKNLGKSRLSANKKRYTAINEAFNATKELKVNRLEQTYIRRFSDAALIYAKNIATAQVIGQLPRHALEAVTFGGMMVIVLYLMLKNNSFSSALPIIALYSFAAYRLMPSLQQIYGGLTQVQFASPAAHALHKDVKSLRPKVFSKEIDEICLKQHIVLKNITYSYPNTVAPSLMDINLKILAGSCVGFVGPTGSGKTTLIDLILGLLEPQKGSLIVDGNVISSKNNRNWQKTIGYVPQEIHLVDDSIAANIALGVQPEDINQNDVERSAKIANLHNFITRELPEGYSTMVGEKGVRLSGGQRQRVGIARALYNNPRVLILDEATSALDNTTEKLITQALSIQKKDTTILMIAHRLSSIKECDEIFLLNRGELIDQGSFNKLKATNSVFKKMTE
ncbi:ABC transporter ATP-binding protein [Alphaproteobacteria bacterium]|nr:ABC transporter ATP-binding protein [Alphaproteobacteria bacterium]